MFHAVSHLAKSFSFLHGIPDRASLLVSRIEVMQLAERRADFVFAGLMLFNRLGSDQKMIECSRRAGRLIREIPPHRGKRDEDFIHVPAVVAGVLFFGGHDSNYGKRKIVQIERLPDGISSREKLLGGIGANECYAARLMHVRPIVEAAVSHVEAANVGKRRIRSGHGERRVVVVAMRANRILLKLRDRVFAIGRILR